MYRVDGKDIVKPNTNFPQSSVGAPIPIILSNEHITTIAYYVQEDFELYGDEDERIAIVKFNMCHAYMFGPPNDEAFSGHPLASRGLKPYSSYIIENSSWINTLEKMNSVHPYHSPELFKDCNHFILSFHDSTFECIATNYEYEIIKENQILNIIDNMKEKLK